MKKLILLLFFYLTIVSLGFAQNQKYFDAAIAVGNGFSPAISINKLWGIGKNHKFKIGTGIRLTAYFAGEQDFITAPAKLTSGKIGPQVLFTENILSNLDTLRLSKTSVSYLNIPIHLQYSFNQKIELGFNIDAIGISFGGNQTGVFYAKESVSLNKSSQTAKPTSFNLLLISDNDLGSLNSELYARYWLNKKIGIRAGLSFQFAEYKSSKKLTFENDRFRAKNLLPMLALSYKF